MDAISRIYKVDFFDGGKSPSFNLFFKRIVNNINLWLRLRIFHVYHPFMHANTLDLIYEYSCRTLHYFKI